MSHSSGEALLLTVVRGCTGFDATNTSRGNFKLLNKGSSDHYAIIHPGQNTITFSGGTQYQAIRQAYVDIWQRYVDDGTSLTNLEGYAANIEAGIMPKKRLGDTTGAITDASITDIGEPQEQWKRGGGPAWLTQRITVTWREDVNISFS